MPETSNTPVGGRGAAGMLSEAQRPRHNRATAAALGAPVITDPAIVAAGERISDLDRAWFKGRPDRAHRVRRMMPNEFPGTMPDGPLAWPVFVIVKQITPGARIRSAFHDPASSVRIRSRRSEARNGEKPAVRSSVKLANDNHDDDLMGRTREVWQPRLGRPLSRDEAKRIAANVTGFFSVLAEWSRAASPTPANDARENVTSDDVGLRRDR